MKRQKASANPFQRLIEALKRMLRREPAPEDPYAYRMAPLRRPPRDRSGTAIAELDEE
jgi:hypothetical protein